MTTAQCRRRPATSGAGAIEIGRYRPMDIGALMHRFIIRCLDGICVSADDMTCYFRGSMALAGADGAISVNMACHIDDGVLMSSMHELARQQATMLSCRRII